MAPAAENPEAEERHTDEAAARGCDEVIRRFSLLVVARAALHGGRGVEARSLAYIVYKHAVDEVATKMD